jgi:hypothetical protein
MQNENEGIKTRTKQKLHTAQRFLAHLLEANGKSVRTEATTAHAQVVLANDGTVVAASTTGDAKHHKHIGTIIPRKFTSHAGAWSAFTPAQNAAWTYQEREPLP